MQRWHCGWGKETLDPADIQLFSTMSCVYMQQIPGIDYISSLPQPLYLRSLSMALPPTHAPNELYNILQQRPVQFFLFLLPMKTFIQPLFILRIFFTHLKRVPNKGKLWFKKSQKSFTALMCHVLNVNTSDQPLASIFYVILFYLFYFSYFINESYLLFSP